MTLDSRTEEKMRQARRRFLASCGKFAVARPPAVTLLLAGERQNYAVAASGFDGSRLARPHEFRDGVMTSCSARE